VGVAVFSGAVKLFLGTTVFAAFFVQISQASLSNYENKSAVNTVIAIIKWVPFHGSVYILKCHTCHSLPGWA